MLRSAQGQVERFMTRDYSSCSFSVYMVVEFLGGVLCMTFVSFLLSSFPSTYTKFASTAMKTTQSGRRHSLCLENRPSSILMRCLRRALRPFFPPTSHPRECFERASVGSLHIGGSRQGITLTATRRDPAIHQYRHPQRPHADHSGLNRRCPIHPDADSCSCRDGDFSFPA